MTIIWLDEAAEDLEQIYDFYFVKSVNAATQIYNTILEEIIILETHPFIAAIEPSLIDKKLEYRSLVTKNGLFKVIYHVADNEIFITTIWCCRSNPKVLLDKGRF